MKNDKQIECQRYNDRADVLLNKSIPIEIQNYYGSMKIPPVLRAPYIYYESAIKSLINAQQKILEIGSGTGLHTYALIQTGARIVASDISIHSLEILEKRIVGTNLITKIADMEKLPFSPNSFDVVVSAGSLSYGDPVLVDSEIQRVLRPGGIFICVDSLNHNPIYKLNRWINYICGERTKSTLINMPTMDRINSISKYFRNVDILYFGSLSWLMMIIAKIIGQDKAAKFSDFCDRIIKVKRSAFKFVLIAKKRI